MNQNHERVTNPGRKSTARTIRTLAATALLVACGTDKSAHAVTSTSAHRSEVTTTTTTQAEQLSSPAGQIRGELRQFTGDIQNKLVALPFGGANEKGQRNLNGKELTDRHLKSASTHNEEDGAMQSQVFEFVATDGKTLTIRAEKSALTGESLRIELSEPDNAGNFVTGWTLQPDNHGDVVSYATYHVSKDGAVANKIADSDVTLSDDTLGIEGTIIESSGEEGRRSNSAPADLKDFNDYFGQKQTAINNAIVQFGIG